MELRLLIQMDNAAFADGPNGSEVAFILRRLIMRWDGTIMVPGLTPLLDSNGNRCGEVVITKESPPPKE